MKLKIKNKDNDKKKLKRYDEIEQDEIKELLYGYSHK